MYNAAGPANSISDRELYVVVAGNRYRWARRMPRNKGVKTIPKLRDQASTWALEQFTPELAARVLRGKSFNGQRSQLPDYEKIAQPEITMEYIVWRYRKIVLDPATPINTVMRALDQCVEWIKICAQQHPWVQEVRKPALSTKEYYSAPPVEQIARDGEVPPDDQFIRALKAVS